MRQGRFGAPKPALHPGKLQAGESGVGKKFTQEETKPKTIPKAKTPEDERLTRQSVHSLSSKEHFAHATAFLLVRDVVCEGRTCWTPRLERASMRDSWGEAA